MEKENYFISIIGTQHYEDDSGEIKLDTVGSYEIIDGVRYISYKEYEDGNPKISNIARLKVESNNTITMSKDNTSTLLILEKGHRHNCLYDTGEGKINLGVFTNEFINELDDCGGKLQVNYTLDVNSAVASRNELKITIKSINS
ncbi:MAG: DUF1934 domain-containing protein [Clostridia bacterium]